MGLDSIVHNKEYQAEKNTNDNIRKLEKEIKVKDKALFRILEEGVAPLHVQF